MEFDHKERRKVPTCLFAVWGGILDDPIQSLLIFFSKQMELRQN